MLRSLWAFMAIAHGLMFILIVVVSSLMIFG